MELKTTGDWVLKSGSWAAHSSTPGLELRRTALGHPVSEQLTRDDIGSLMLARRSESDRALHFPPEFSFCPVSGAPLEPAAALAERDAWAAPFGGQLAMGNTSSNANGLRQAAHAIRLARGYEYNEDGAPDNSLPVPPPGDYEFFSASFGTADAALISLDSHKGTLFAWLPESKKWSELKAAGLLLSETELNRSAWRAELALEFNSRLYLPTRQGLACVTLDVPSLSYNVAYFGGGRSVAAPACFDGKVWAPLQASGGAIQCVSVDLAGQEAATLAVAGAPELGAVSLPVTYGRHVIWPCENGQLRLHKQTDGSVVATFIGWPAGIVPDFQFGSPYLSRDGALWQLCFDITRNSYLYLKLGGEPLELVDAQGPRFCSGSVNYRFAAKLKTEPWVEPELGDDASSNDVVIPLIESSAGASVVGLKIESNSGLAEVLASEQRIRSVLVMDDENTGIAFHTFAVAQPWRMRLFCHEGTLWAYHPRLNRIDGWDLQA